MHPAHHRAARIDVAHHRRNDFVMVVDRLLPQLSHQLETALPYAVVWLLWGFIIYLALTLAIQ